jgi:hypothetical protein
LPSITAPNSRLSTPPTASNRFPPDIGVADLQRSLLPKCQTIWRACWNSSIGPRQCCIAANTAFNIPISGARNAAIEAARAAFNVALSTVARLTRLRFTAAMGGIYRRSIAGNVICCCTTDIATLGCPCVGGRRTPLCGAGNRSFRGAFFLFSIGFWSMRLRLRWALG